MPPGRAAVPPVLIADPRDTRTVACVVNEHSPMTRMNYRVTVIWTCANRHMGCRVTDTWACACLHMGIAFFPLQNGQKAAFSTDNKVKVRRGCLPRCLYSATITYGGKNNAEHE